MLNLCVAWVVNMYQMALEWDRWREVAVGHRKIKLYPIFSVLQFFQVSLKLID